MAERRFILAIWLVTLSMSVAHVMLLAGCTFHVLENVRLPSTPVVSDDMPGPVADQPMPFYFAPASQPTSRPASQPSKPPPPWWEMLIRGAGAGAEAYLEERFR